MMKLILFLLIGAMAGWLAGKMTKGKGFGFLGNMVVGVIGAFIGGFLFTVIGIVAFGLIGSLIMAVIGALVFLWLIRLLKKI